MNIVVSADSNKEIIVFPVIPRDIRHGDQYNNEEFQTINNGTLNIMGDRGLRSVSFDSIFPKAIQTWAKAGSVEGQEYVDFFKKWKAKRVPIRIIMTKKDGSEILNMACSIEIFDYYYDKVENIKYSLNLKEYRYIRGV